ncbi:MAG: SPASM domain-containing protein [Chitinivibrionales bacterium]|nr:SPASM domain-containing protein [Chitinivibrionales bacterium]
MNPFRKTYIEISNLCNRSCSFCPKTSRAPQEMSPAQFEEVLLKIKGRSDFIYYHVLGEPLMHPHLSELLEISHKHKFRGAITTNGTLIQTAGAALIGKPALRQINFSLHGFAADPALQDRRGSQAFSPHLGPLKTVSTVLEKTPDRPSLHNISECALDDYLDNIFTFTHALMTHGDCIISFRLWNGGSEKHTGHSQHILERIKLAFNCDISLQDQTNPVAGVKIAENVYLNRAEAFEWPTLKKDPICGPAFCLGLRDQIAILADGTVTPCCLDAEGIINLGNIFTQELADILRGARARNLYNGFSRREAVEELCRRCTYRLRFEKNKNVPVIS